MDLTNWAKTFTESLAAEIKKSREKQDLSLNEVGTRAGLSQQYIGYIERSMRCPTVDSLARIAHALGITPSTLTIAAEKRTNKLLG